MFETARYSNLYDAATNQILRLTPDAARLVDDFYRGKHEQEFLVRSFGRQAHRKAVEFLSALRERTGVLNPQVPESVSALPISTESASNRLFSLVLNVTEACNLRCGYCVYGGSYPSKRVHAAHQMSWETAKAAIDYVAAHSKSSTSAVRMLGWYGGEPFLNLDVIRRSDDYFRERFKTFKVKFNVTSNAVNWSDAIINFLVENDVDLTVSFDRDVEDHDAQRRTLRGKGTLVAVRENLTRLQRINDKYFAAKISINSVISEDTDLSRLNSYFAAIPLRVSISIIGPHDVSGFSSLPVTLTGWNEMRALFQRGCLERAFDTPQFGKMRYNFVYYLFIRDIERIHRREPSEGFPPTLAAHGCCQPGVERIFVSCNGEIETCEKTDRASKLRLGHLKQERIDDRRRLDMFNNFNNMEFSDCRRCFNVRLCTICFAHALYGDDFSPQKRRWNFAASPVPPIARQRNALQWPGTWSGQNCVYPSANTDTLWIYSAAVGLREGCHARYTIETAREFSHRISWRFFADVSNKTHIAVAISILF